MCLDRRLLRKVKPMRDLRASWEPFRPGCSFFLLALRPFKVHTFFASFPRSFFHVLLLWLLIWLEWHGLAFQGHHGTEQESSLLRDLIKNSLNELGSSNTVYLLPSRPKLISVVCQASKDALKAELSEAKTCPFRG